MRTAKEYDENGVLTGGLIVYYEPHEIPSETKLKANKELRLSKELLKDWVMNQGNYFYFLVYKNLLEDFPDDTALIFRFMYICSYGDYNNTLVYGKHDMTPIECKKLFGLSEKPNREIYRSLIDWGLLIENNLKVTINPKYYIRGSIKDYDAPFTRIFNKGIQELYTKADYREHKLLGHFVPLLPFVNKYNNIICANPEENDVNKLVPLNLSQVAALFGVNQTNSNRLKQKLLDITVNNIPVLGYFTREFNHEYLKCFIVNPYVFYKAPKLDELENIARLFNIPANTY